MRHKGKTARERAYGYLLDEIFSGRLQPGDHVREEGIAEQCGISRTPIRQAMADLIDEGLLRPEDNKRTYVVDLSSDELEQIFDLSAMLESYSAGLAATNASAGQIAAMHELQDRMEQCFAEDPANERLYLKLNSEFHKAVHLASNHKILYDLIVRVVDVPIGVYLKTGKVTDSSEALWLHRQIVEAIEARDAPMARDLMNLHVETVRRQFRDVLTRAEEKG